MFICRVGLFIVLMFTGITDFMTYGSVIHNGSYLLLSDKGYGFENVDFNYVDIYDNTYNSKTADIYGGYIENVGAHSLSTVNLYAGCIFDIHACDSSTVNIYDGSVYTLAAYATSEVNILGGVFEDYDVWASVWAYGYSQVTISGATFADVLKASENSTITIFGSDFAIDGLSVGYGPITAASGILTGTLTSGETINNDFYIYDNATIVLIPEPATILLFGLASLTLLRKRRRLRK
jgi:hypothetical protein